MTQVTQGINKDLRIQEAENGALYDLWEDGQLKRRS